jgi:hypothetical protein
MTIRELIINKTDMKQLDISWRLSDGAQSSYELFLIQGDSVVERVKRSSDTTRCSLCTTIDPMKEYGVLLTVKSGRLLSTARAGFYAAEDKPMSQYVSYHKHG